MSCYEVFPEADSIEEACRRILRLIEANHTLMQRRRAEGRRHAMLVFALLLIVAAIAELQKVM